MAIFFASALRQSPPEAFNALETRYQQHPIQVTDALFDAVEHWIKRHEADHVSGCGHGFLQRRLCLAGAFLQSRQVPTECGAPCAPCSPVARSEWLRRFCQIQRGSWWLLWLAWMMLITAVARPQWIGEPIELPNTGRDLMLGLDLSGSMQIEDMQIGSRLVPRITAVKAIAADFTQRRQGDRVGLILFGTRAYLQAPLTFDLSTVTRFIDEAQLGFAGEDTAIGDALGLAIKRLRERPASSRIFVLLTDGQDTASTVDPMEAAALAAQLNVKIYTIGISRNLGRTSRGRAARWTRPCSTPLPKPLAADTSVPPLLLNSRPYTLCWMSSSLSSRKPAPSDPSAL